MRSILFLILTCFSTHVLAQFKLENYELLNHPEDSTRLAELALFKKDKEGLRTFLMSQESSLQARELAFQANKWRKASNVMWIGMGASVVTGLVVTTSAETQEAMALGVITGIIGGGLFYYLASGFSGHANYLLTESKNIYVRPHFDQITSAGLSFTLRF